MNHRDYVARREAQEPAFRRARQALQPEYALRRALIDARLARGLSQQDLAKEMGTSQAAIARWEAGHTVPQLSTLMRFARVLQARIQITPSGAIEITRSAKRQRPNQATAGSQKRKAVGA